MSTKYLARTAIEGGRRYSNTDDRRESNRAARTHYRQVLLAVRTDIGMVDDVQMPQREHVYKDFRDKLAPLARWMKSCANRPWNKVRSEIVAMVDTRTLAGRHIVYDHLLPRRRWHRVITDTEDLEPPWSVHRTTFRVDRHGILRVEDSGRNRRKLAHDFEAAWAFASPQRVGVRGKKLYWLVRTNLDPQPPRYRQARELSTEERVRFERFSAAAQHEIVISLGDS